MSKYTRALLELKEAYAYAARLCADPPDDDFESMIEAMEEVGPADWSDEDS